MISTAYAMWLLGDYGVLTLMVLGCLYIVTSILGALPALRRDGREFYESKKAVSDFILFPIYAILRTIAGPWPVLLRTNGWWDQ